MQDFFDKEFLYVERELNRLKTSAQKSAIFVESISKTINVSVNLKYEDISYPTGSARAEARYEISSDNDIIFVPTLSWYYGNIYEAADVRYTTRKIRLYHETNSNGREIIRLYFFGTEYGNDSDAARTKRGETVTVSVDLTVIATDDFNITRIR